MAVTTNSRNSAVNKNEEYAEVEVNGEVFIFAKERLDKVLTDEKHNVVEYVLRRTFNGDELVGKGYEPLFENRGKNAHKIWHADYVSMEEGTGLVHLAPAYGEEDYALAKQLDFPFVSVIDDNGFYSEGEWLGQNVWEANKPIAKELHARGVVWKIEYIIHSYPHCYRCGTKLMYRAHPSWFMDIDGQRSEMLEQNSQVNWYPNHIRDGRSAKTMQTAPDWNLSRDRFWATAMPIWKGTDAAGKELIKVVGSYDELKKLSGVELDDYHRPWVDDIEFDLGDVHYRRIDKVMDCWFESGSMPFAQFHYPFENTEKFEANFPGDFIVEYIPQVRAWFYYMNAVNVGLFGKVPFRTAIAHGTIAGNDGRKMSKSYGNYTDPNALMDLFSADALRFLFLSSNLLNGEDFALKDKDVQDVQRKLAMIWNMYDFFTMYAEVDKWQWTGSFDDPTTDVSNTLDVWIVSRLHQLSQHITEHMDSYDIPGALEVVLPFLDDASNWYVRRSRRRFWKNGDDADKNEAYATLHYVLVQLSVLMAPFTPFLSEEVYQKLTGGESVHLLDWPKAGTVQQDVLDKMVFVREAINEGLSQRASNGIKVRQPLLSISIPGVEALIADDKILRSILLEELNVQSYQDSSEDEKVILNLTITPALKREGLMRELIRQIQTHRKAAGFKVDDRITLGVESEDQEVLDSLTEFKEIIMEETLATNIGMGDTTSYRARVIVDGFPVTLLLAVVES